MCKTGTILQGQRRCILGLVMIGIGSKKYKSLIGEKKKSYSSLCYLKFQRYEKSYLPVIEAIPTLMALSYPISDLVRNPN